MSDLIRRSDVLELLYKIFDKYCMSTDKNTSIGKSFGTSVFEEIRNIPIAYSVDKVVEELEEMKTIKGSMKTVTCRKWDYGTVNRAIEIVKQGGMADDVCEPSADKIKVTSLEVIVTGKREKPYYEIKYKEVGEIDYKIGYSSYDLNNVFAWRDEFFEIVNHK